MCKPTAELTTFVGTVTPYLPAKTTGSSSTGELITVQNSPSGITMSFDQSTTPVGEDQSTSQGSDAKERSSTSAALIAVSGQPLTLQKTDSREHDLSLSPSPVSQGNTFPVVADKNRCISVAGGNPLIPEDAETVPEAPAPTTTFFSTIKSWFTFPEIDFKQLIKDARQYNLLETTAKAAWKVGLLTASLITTAFVFFPPVTAALVGVGLVVAALGLIGGYAYTLYRAPEVSEQAAATTVSLVKNRSELCQARAGAAVAAEITFINGGGEEAIKTATEIGYTVANIGAKMNDTERAMAVIAALSMAIGQSELIGYLCLNPQLVKGSAGVGAGFGAFILGETKGTARVATAAVKSAVVANNLVVPAALCVISGNPLGVVTMLASRAAIAHGLEWFLPEGMEKSIIAEAVSLLLNGMMTERILGSAADEFTALAIPPIISALAAAYTALDIKYDGWLTTQSNQFLTASRENVTKAVESMNLVAVHAPENTLKVMKLAMNAFRELFWPAEEASDREVLAATTVSVVSSETEETNSGSTSYFGRASQLFSNLADKISSGFFDPAEMEPVQIEEID